MPSNPTPCEVRTLRRFITHDGQPLLDEDYACVQSLSERGYCWLNEDGYDGPCWELTEKGRAIAGPAAEAFWKRKARSDE